MCNPASCFNPSAIPPTHTHTANCVFQTLWKMTGNGFIPLPPCVDPAVHFTSIYSSPGLRPKRERKVKMAVKHSWLLWLQKNLGGGKLAVVYQGHEGVEQGLPWPSKRVHSVASFQTRYRGGQERQRKEFSQYQMSDWKHLNLIKFPKNSTSSFKRNFKSILRRGGEVKWIKILIQAKVLPPNFNYIRVLHNMVWHGRYIFQMNWVPGGCAFHSISASLLLYFTFLRMLSQWAIKHLKENLTPSGNPASWKFRFQNFWIQSNFARKLTTPSGNPSQERLCNWVVCFKYLRRKICKYLHSNKYFNIVPLATKLYFKFPSTSEQHPEHNTILGHSLCQQGLYGPLMSGKLVCIKLKARWYATWTLLCKHGRA